MGMTHGKKAWGIKKKREDVGSTQRKQKVIGAHHTDIKGMRRNSQRRSKEADIT